MGKAEFVTFELGLQLPEFLSSFPETLTVISPRGWMLSNQIIHSHVIHIPAMHALLSSLRPLNCRISFSNELKHPHLTNDFVPNFVTGCLQ